MSSGIGSCASCRTRAIRACSRSSARSPGRRARGCSSPTGAACSTCAPTTTSTCRRIRTWWRPPAGRSSSGATACPPCASSVARRRCTPRLEEAIASFLGMEAAILYSSCFDANGGLFETLLGPEDAVISDALNHASVIDGIRLCKAQRYRYRNCDMADLEAKLKEARGGAHRPDRDGRRVLDGRRDRAPRGHLRARRALRRPGHGRRLARAGRAGRARARHARAPRRRASASTSSPARWARRSAARAAASRAAPARWSSCSGSALAPISSRTVWRR